MNTTIIIQTENSEKLKILFNKINSEFDKSSINLLLHSKNYEPWQDTFHHSTITSFKSYFAFPSKLPASESVVELIINCKTENIIIADENSETTTLHYFQTKELLKLNLDTKYKSLKWFVIDLVSQQSSLTEFEQDNSSDCQRFLAKINSPLFKEKIIYIDGGMGDHIMSLPLITKLSKDIYVSCKYPFIYDNLNIKGFIDWNDELFGGYNRFVYVYGSSHNSATIIDAFFEIYGEIREESDKMLYTNREDSVIETDKKIALICTSAAKINDQDSNKDWSDIRWFKLVHELQKKDYFVIQVGGVKDNQIPNVDMKFLDNTLPKLASLVDRCDLWISVDTFFHHFASAIKPNAGICLTPFYNDHAKHPGVNYVEKNCEKNFHERRWWLDLQQPERKECMYLIKVEDVLNKVDFCKKKIKIKIISGKINFENITNWRAYSQYFGEIEGVDIDFDKPSLYSNEIDEKYDIFILTRPIIGWIDYVKHLKQIGKKVVIDFDDPFPMTSDKDNIKLHINESIELMDMCDLVTTTNERMRDYFMLHSKNTNIVALPNIINEAVIDEHKTDNHDKVILGWFGTHSHYSNLLIIHKIILETLNRYDHVYLNLYSDNQKTFDLFEHPKVRNINYNPNFSQFQHSIGDIDINLAPLQKNYLNLHKSNIRITLPGYKGIPTIATDFADYGDLGNDNVLLCNSDEDWFNNLKLLIEDNNLRSSYAKKIKDYVKNNLTFSKWTNHKSDMFKKLIYN